MPKTINACKLRTNLGEFLNRVFYKGAEFIIERKGKPLAKITPLKAGTREFVKGHRTNSVLLKLAGILSDEEAKAIEEGIENLRKISRKRRRKISNAF